MIVQNFQVRAAFIIEAVIVRVSLSGHSGLVQMNPHADLCGFDFSRFWTIKVNLVKRKCFFTLPRRNVLIQTHQVGTGNRILGQV